MEDDQDDGPSSAWRGHPPEANHGILDQMTRGETAHVVFGHPESLSEMAMPGAVNAAYTCISRFLVAPEPDLLKQTLAMDAARLSIRSCDKEVGRVGDVLISTRLAHVLTELGIDPVAYAITALYMVGDQQGGLITVGSIPIELYTEKADADQVRIVTGTIKMATNVFWYSHGDRIDVHDGLPETLLIAAIGRSLASVVSHPLLDDQPAIIEYAYNEGLGDGIAFIGYTPADTITLDELMLKRDQEGKTI